MSEREEPSYLAFARMNVRDGLTSSATIVRGLVARIDRDASALKAAQPRTISTVEELDALPEGSVIRTSGVEDECDPRVAIKSGFWNSESEWFTADDSEWCLSSDELDDLPATVLYEPQP